MRDPLRVLAIDDDPGFISLLEEAFSEMADARFERAWMPFCVRDYSLDIEEGLAKMAGARFDAVLFSSNLAPFRGLPAFRHLISHRWTAAPIALLEDGDEALGIGLLRQGAQDCLFKSELDCVPLARVLMNATERQRLAVAQRQSSLYDDVTGLNSARALAELGQREWAAATRPAEWMGIFLADKDARHESDPDLQAILASESIRTQLTGRDLAGRIDQFRFVVLLAGDSEVELESRSSALASALAGYRSVWSFDRPSRSSGDFEQLWLRVEALCENGRVADRARRHV